VSHSIAVWEWIAILLAGFQTGFLSVWTGGQARRLPLVQRERRLESRRGRLKARATVSW